jgi:cysteine desulfurase
MIYMDSHSTTRVDPRVLEAMLPFFSEHYGNASSRNHPFGWKAAKAVEAAREQVAALIGARFRDVVFTSGATESNNLAIKGVAAAGPPERRHIVTVGTEHRAVLDPCRALERTGFTVTYLPVAPDGLIDLAQLDAAVTDQTLLVSVMAANNEIGVLQPLGAIGRIVKARGAIFHSDVVQAAGSVPIDVNAAGIDLASLSAHKIYGPKGVGALYVRRGIAVEPLIAGGGHERGLRSGTLNVPAIVGFGQAAAICGDAVPDEARRVGALRDRLWEGLRMDRIHLNGSLEHRLPQNLNIRIDGAHGDTLLKSLASDVAISSGAACATTSAEPSHVLKALGLTDDQARASLRFGLGRFNSALEVDRVVDLVRCRLGS